MQLRGIGIKGGVWEGVLTSDSDPKVDVWYQDQLLPGTTIGPLQSGGYALRTPIPAHLLSEGVQTFVIRVAGTAEVLGHFTIIAGEVLDQDLRAEIDLLRAELDMLKRAFRQHCTEKSPTADRSA